MVRSINRAAALLLLAAASCSPVPPQAAPQPSAKPSPIVAGFERFPKDDAVERGRLLLRELNCVACHRADGLRPLKGPDLADAGARLRPQWIKAWVTDPHTVKPGTPMPHLLDGIADEAVEPLVHYLMSLRGSEPLKRWTWKLGDGKNLYDRVGCRACHEGPGGVPLGDPKAKYHSAATLAHFLFDPLKWRPAGRMPKMNLTRSEATGMAAQMLGLHADPREPDDPDETAAGLAYSYYEGSWHKIPDFDALKPAATGTSPSFDIGVRKRDELIGLVFFGFVEIPKDGTYTFFTRSDDGSRLVIGDLQVVDNDGDHGTREAGGSIALNKGKHAIRVEWYEHRGGENLTVLYQGPDIGKRQIPRRALSHHPSGKYVARPESVADAFEADAGKARQGRTLFGKLGCVACHEVPDPPKARPSKPLARLKEANCMNADYGLNEAQQRAIEAALAAMDRPDDPSPARRIMRTMTALNCFACHERKGRGGPEPDRRKHFVLSGTHGTEQDLAEEGRIPPRLDDAGAKLAPSWLKEILQRGTKVRPYMATRMPVFGAENVAHLMSDFEKADAVAETPRKDSLTRAQALRFGRQLVGRKGMSCIVCHVFNGHALPGIQAMDLALMPKRLTRGWYDRYLRNPSALRPGTRMTSFWPGGESARMDILGGDNDRQIEAIWRYLAEGESAVTPHGLMPNAIVLEAKDEAIIYRNFIEGAGPRAIAVGYPEQANLAFDANQMRLALIWQGEFIDASKHWVGRGSGFQKPYGDNVLKLHAGAPFAVLADADAVWPKATGKKAGYEFEGYQLDKPRRPTFFYSFSGVSVHDFPEAVAGDPDPTLRRTFTFEAKEPPEDLWYRAAAGQSIKLQSDGSYLVGGKLRLRFELSAGEPVIHKNELRVPVRFRDGKAKIVQHYQW